MTAFAFFLALFVGQINTSHNKQIVHLPPHRTSIDTAYSGKLVELINPPPTLTLPTVPPKQGSQGGQWYVDVKNLGPASVTIIGKPSFSASIDPNQTIHILSNGDGYLLKH